MNGFGSINISIATKFRERFAADCIEGILLGYEKMYLEKLYDVNSVEDNLTAHLVRNMEEVGYLTAKDIIVDPQHKLYSKNVFFGTGNPAKSPTIDLKFGKIWARTEHKFYAEAKNLSEKNWRKTSGKAVIASDSRSYYISDGIERYLSEYYPKGCLIGYVVNGTVSGVVSKLNNLLIRRGVGPRVGTLKQDTGATRNCCFMSDNELSPGNIFTLRHLILQLV
ncbi:hypothetical protein ACO2Q8_22545 [Larkinella sp. VNQ87]|uniref:hypothetical protein n=1 Tax=Larkinella sp. VNQ87 TaxID=3400921 RepID=UPI003C0DE5D4